MLRVFAIAALALSVGACASSTTPRPAAVPVAQLDLWPLIEAPVARATDDPNIRISEYALADCDRRKAWLPEKGEITQTRWQFANRRNEKNIDRCADRHALLVDEVKALLGYIRDHY